MNLQEAIMNAINAKQDRANKRAENKNAFEKINADVISAYKELSLKDFSLEVPSIGKINVTEKGIELGFDPELFSSRYEKELTNVLIYYFEELAKQYAKY